VLGDRAGAGGEKALGAAVVAAGDGRDRRVRGEGPGERALDLVGEVHAEVGKAIGEGAAGGIPEGAARSRERFAVASAAAV
jgi:hypothetical protein